MRKPLNIRLDTNEVFVTGGTWPLGTRGHSINKRTYRFAKNGATVLTQGHLVQRAAPDRTLNGVLVAGATAEKVTPQVLLLVNSNFDINGGEYEEGLLFVVAGSGAGLVLPVAGNATYFVSEGDTQLSVAIEHFPTPDDLDATSRVVLLRNTFRAVTQTEAPAGQEVLGVAPVDVAANAYFWLQTAGPTTVLQQDSLVALAPVASSDFTRGAVQSAVQVVPTVLNEDSPEGAQGFVQVPTLDTEGGDIRERLAEVSGLAVVQGTRIGTCLVPQGSGEFALINLELE